MRSSLSLLLLLAGCATARPSAPPSAPLGMSADAELLALMPGAVPSPPVPVPVPVPVPDPPPPSPAPAPPPTPTTTPDAHLLSLLSSSPSPILKQILASPEAHRFQILYARVSPQNQLERASFRADAEYFFPASTMKMPIALAAFDRLAVLAKQKPFFTRDATLRIHPRTPSEPTEATTLAYETRRALIVSDNAAANRLLAIVGHRELHETLWGVGLASARVHTGFATGAELDPAEVSPAVDVIEDGAPRAALPARKSTLALPPTDAKNLAIGEASIVDGRRVPGPMSFAKKNAMKLRDLQDTLVHILRPELLTGKSKAKDTLTDDDRAFLRTTLGTLPSESGLPGYARNMLADRQHSPFLKGLERVRPRGKFQIFQKVGQAYGFLIHNAYVVEKDTGKAFFLIAAVYANPEGVMNSDRYAYDTVSFPALADLGELIARDAFGDSPANP